MNVDEFEALMDRCKIMLNDNGEVSFVPYSDKDRMRISKIITDNNLQNFRWLTSMLLFNSIILFIRHGENSGNRKPNNFQN